MHGSFLRILKLGFTDHLSIYPSDASPWSKSLSSWMAANVVGAKISQKMWDGPWWEGVWPFLDPWDVVGLRTAASVWNVPKKYGP